MGISTIPLQSNTNIDIIAIHGLDTTSPETWLWKDQHDPKNQDLWVNWLKESNMLPREVGPARIFTCDWPADPLETSDIVQATNQVHARGFLDGLRRHFSHANDTAQTSRPLLFIASCLGGIILMQALVEADNVKSDYRQRVNWLFDNVKSLSTYLNDLVKKFTLLCQDKAFPCHVFTFYEAKTTILPWKTWPRLLSTQKALVNESSATLDFVPDPLPLNRNHKLMNKFENERCDDYRVVASKICHFLENIRNAKSPLQQADEWLETRIYDDEKLRIERLSGSYLPMKDCYINLAIVERPKGANQDGGTEREGRPQYNQFSQEARLKVNTPGKDSEVDLATLFSPRQQANGTIIHPRRILIHGRAGIGKTTLCKKIVFEFREHNWPEWSKLFDRILWIPLRNLKLPDRQVAGYNFKLLCYHEFFSDQSREDLAQALSDDSAESRTLFLLDGLDEVSQDLSGHDSMSNFLRTKLLRQPNVIITSRPYPRLPEGIDLGLETIGFHPDQATRYLRASLDEGKADKIESFLRDHPLMQSLTRIPIQLDAFCFLWGGEKSLRAVDTMTEVYRAIEEGLWKKDIIRLGKKRDGKLVAPGHLESATWRELELHAKEESMFLERLAFSGMEHEIVEFDKQRLDDALVDSELSIDKTVPNLSFLRCSDTSRSLHRRTYHFIHLTYQEYFAAKYFVRMYSGMPHPNTMGNANSQPALDLLQIWRFAAGLLGSKHVASFFEAIETKPIDVVGTVHQRLVMHCLSEANMRDCSSTQRRLEDGLSQWLLFTSHFEKSTNAMLSTETEFPDQSLFDALEMGSHSQKIQPPTQKYSIMPFTLLEPANYQKIL
ncbi:hypothetical protein GGS24DRAFT_494731 [Hypoxylon argillaceum]|nr:hypothetical protein GGS24DRAFT_494731 [Hypoxylon argillaceum]